MNGNDGGVYENASRCSLLVDDMHACSMMEVANNEHLLGWFVIVEFSCSCYFVEFSENFTFCLRLSDELPINATKSPVSITHFCWASS